MQLDKDILQLAKSFEKAQLANDIGDALGMRGNSGQEICIVAALHCVSACLLFKKLRLDGWEAILGEDQPCVELGQAFS